MVSSENINSEFIGESLSFTEPTLINSQNREISLSVFQRITEVKLLLSL